MSRINRLIAERDTRDKQISALQLAFDRVVAERDTARAQVEKLEALFQQTKGCHWTWVEGYSALQAKAARVVALLTEAQQWLGDSGDYISFRGRVKAAQEALK